MIVLIAAVCLLGALTTDRFFSYNNLLNVYEQSTDLALVSIGQTLTILTSTGWRPTITQVTVAATSGMVIAVGFLLLLAGLVVASARRRGVHLGEFRERHKI